MLKTMKMIFTFVDSVKKVTSLKKMDHVDYALLKLTNALNAIMKDFV